jgi:sarcosine/dimethylglycine N-methyltransferase
VADVDVISFYDEHPINEDHIMSELPRRGHGAGRIPPDVLFELDQDHYGGIEAVEALARLGGLTRGRSVLDVCAGLGGPLRFLAWRHGCPGTGVDLNHRRARSAARLTRMVGLDGAVRMVRADATALPFRSAAFDVCISQEAWLHITDKAAIARECRRVLRPGGRLAFTDWVARPRLTDGERERLRSWMAATTIQTLDGYRHLLGRSGFMAIETEDLSPDWKADLRERLHRYRRLRPETVARFGQPRYDAYDQPYTFFVGLVEDGKLGGGRFSATAAPSWRAGDPAAGSLTAAGSGRPASRSPREVSRAARCRDPPAEPSRAGWRRRPAPSLASPASVPPWASGQPS